MSSAINRHNNNNNNNFSKLKLVIYNKIQVQEYTEGDPTKN